MSPSVTRPPRTWRDSTSRPGASPPRRSSRTNSRRRGRGRMPARQRTPRTPSTRASTAARASISRPRAGRGSGPGGRTVIESAVRCARCAGGRSRRSRTRRTGSRRRSRAGRTPWTSWPLRYVPFVEPRSSRNQTRPRNVSTAWSADTNSSSTTTRVVDVAAEGRDRVERDRRARRRARPPATRARTAGRAGSPTLRTAARMSRHSGRTTTKKKP